MNNLKQASNNLKDRVEIKVPDVLSRLALVLTVWGMLFNVVAQDTETKQLSAVSQASAALQQLVENNVCVGAAAGFAVGTEISWQEGAGFQDSDNNNVFGSFTLSRIASIAKPMTAVAIMQLYEQELIDLDAPLQEYIPEFPVKEQGVLTIRQLLGHSSGIGAYKSGKEQENYKEYPTLSDAMALFADRDLLFAPGTEFYYTSYGYVVLGVVIERVSGMTYEDYMQLNIWSPAGMKHTGIEVYGNEYPNKTDLYHRNSKGKIKSIDQTNLSDRVPGGGVYSNVPDILSFGQALLSNSLITSESFNLMISDTGLKTEGSGNGFGWYLYGENPRYGNLVGHTGAQLGCSAQLMLLPEVETVIIVLSNTSGAMQEVSNLSVQLFDIAASASNN